MNNVLPIAIVVLAVGFVAFVAVKGGGRIQSDADECARVGGILVKLPEGRACIDAKVIELPKASQGEPKP